jgi:hypothetical protein
MQIPGLHGVARTVTHMHAGWLAIAVVLELLSCHAYVLAFLQVFDRAQSSSAPASRSPSRRSGPLSRSAAPAA